MTQAAWDELNRLQEEVALYREQLDELEMYHVAHVTTILRILIEKDVVTISEVTKMLDDSVAYIKHRDGGEKSEETLLRELLRKYGTPGDLN